ncbi:hypothetical protein GEV33_004049 [Tenebrio molitor]|uniref:Sugar transporter SWEET1 n=1 Tax=Tenebrio molitor TaxID=7067 RepID=A0A8J6HQY7_TENMO|nr:hypothetical protein GEV33_004049 [Tenebrio molitor]
MESAAKLLQPYKDVIGRVASFLTIAQFFSGVFICRDIQKKGNTRDVSSVPFVGGIMVGLAMLKYGLLLQDDVMLVVNVTAIVLNAIYCAFYYLYSGDKWNELFKPLSISMGLVAVLWGYCAWEDPTLLEFRYGLIVTILMLLLLGNPLLGVREMIQNKDASQIPFVLTLMGTLVTFAWLLYAIILMNNFMIQNYHNHEFVGFSSFSVTFVMSLTIISATCHAISSFFLSSSRLTNLRTTFLSLNPFLSGSGSRSHSNFPSAVILPHDSLLLLLRFHSASGSDSSRASIPTSRLLALLEFISSARKALCVLKLLSLLQSDDRGLLFSMLTA